MWQCLFTFNRNVLSFSSLRQEIILCDKTQGYSLSDDTIMFLLQNLRPIHYYSLHEVFSKRIFNNFYLQWVVLLCGDVFRTELQHQCDDTWITNRKSYTPSCTLLFLVVGALWLVRIHSKKLNSFYADMAFSTSYFPPFIMFPISTVMRRDSTHDRPGHLPNYKLYSFLDPMQFLPLQNLIEQSL